MDGEQTSRDLGLDKVLFPKREIFCFVLFIIKSHSQPQNRCGLLLSLRQPTCAFPYDGVEFGAKKSLGVVEYELHHHRLDSHLHEGRRAAKTCRLDLPGPGGNERSITRLTAKNHRHTKKLKRQRVQRQRSELDTQDDDPEKSPEEIRGPDNSQVFGVHVSGGAEGGQVGEVSHEVFQSPVGQTSRASVFLC